MAGGHGPDGPKVSTAVNWALQNVPELQPNKHMMKLEWVSPVVARKFDYIIFFFNKYLISTTRLFPWH